MQVHDFTIPKQNQSASSNQDSLNYDLSRKVFAIADGVTTSPSSGLWSKIIVEHFLEEPFCHHFNDEKNSDELFQKWLESSIKVFREKTSTNNTNQFIKDMINDKGASTTLIGCRIIKNKNTHQLQIWAIGDSNVFLIRKNRILSSFPIKKLEDFTNFTNALSSILELNNQKLDYINLDIKTNDEVIIATDAFSKWFLWASNNGQKPWKRIIKKKSKISEYIEKLRSHQKIDDDDTSFIHIKFD